MARTGSAAGPTLAVIAREAGVSVPTASKVLNGRADVAPDTRRRVTEVLERLGYVRRPRAGAPRARPAMVDLVVRSPDGPRAGAVLHGVMEAAREAGLEVVVSVADGPGGPGGPGGRPTGPGWPEKLAARGSAGVLFHLPGLSPGRHAWLDGHGIPYVLIDPARRPPPGAAYVGADDERGGSVATGHLLALGHRRIAVLAGRPGTPLGEARLAGHRAALAAAGIAPRPEYVRHGDSERACARRRTLALLGLPEPPTALFACSDVMALGAYEALAVRGLRVPADVSVIGFGDLPEAGWSSPALTTVRRPLSAMAATALRLLDRMVCGERPEILRTELSTRLVPRHSTAPAAARPLRPVPASGPASGPAAGGGPEGRGDGTGGCSGPVPRATAVAQ
ncbi:LacI family DNA-binding transcriptional regulator [Streptomyces sp. F63]|uniref:LacI family DNA-binding transcriptional regulator n=1 Tax=Streptomyces sp. F63 TaxID=2824887 RepID=UPI001B36C16B|nr:LacI family DNA-binding transcriptional regulator [Streptomyces sp. F63]MBQ0986997.1 LacI family DNA-binding transcriptional regulator [Streptomyces sp. F63]